MSNAVFPAMPLAVPPPPSPPLETATVADGGVESLNAVLAATAASEVRLPLALNAYGQWCTRGIGGWRPHPSYHAAWAAAHAEEVT